MTIPAKHRITIQRSALVAVALLLMSASLGATAAQAAQIKRCGTVLYRQGQDRVFGIKASGVSCATARKMTGQWRANLFGQTRGCKTNKFCRVRNFTCRSAPSRQIDLLIDCRRPGARVTWRNGAPVGSCVYTYSCRSSRPTDGEAFRV